MLWLTAAAAGQLRVANYNSAQIQGDTDSLAEVFATMHADDQPGFATPVSVFIFQEVRQQDLSVLLDLVNAAAPAGVNYAQGTYSNFSEDNTAGAQAMFYRSDMLVEDVTEHDDIFTGAGRYADRWKLELVDYSSPQASFYIYSAHLKADDGASDQQQRLEGVLAILNNAATLPVGSHVIYAGDFNFTHHNEPGYLELVSPGVMQGFDPLGTGSWSGPGNAIKHTQSPRANGFGGLIGGGLDDRFDFQFTTSSFVDNDGLAIISETYRAFGNDGAHFNQSINAGTNTYFPNDIPSSNALADALHTASDHLPLVVDYQIPAVLSAGVEPGDVGRVITGTNVSLTLTLSNDAEVDDALGADVIDYVADGTGNVLGLEVGLIEAGGQVVHDTFAVNTLTVGPLSGAIAVDTSNEAIEIASMSTAITGTSLEHADPSFESDANVNVKTVTGAFEAGTGVHELVVPIYNFGFFEFQSLLDVDAVPQPDDPFAFTGDLPTGVGSEPGELVFTFDSDGLSSDVYESAPLLISASDEDIPGQSSYLLVLSFEIVVEPGGSTCVADLNGDTFVGVADLLQLLSAWGPCAKCDADITGDDVVGVADLLELLGAWGACE